MQEKRNGKMLRDAEQERMRSQDTNKAIGQRLNNEKFWLIR